MDDTNPVLLVLPLHNTSALDIIKGISDVETQESDNKTYHKLLLDNKYYTAEIDILVADYDLDTLKQIQGEKEAIIVYFDPSTDSCVESIDTSCRAHQNLELKLLVTDGFADEKLESTKQEVMQWCIQNGWELIELNPDTSDSDSESEDALEDSYGFTRIKQALNAHEWSNLIMKALEHISQLCKLWGLDEVHLGWLTELIHWWLMSDSNEKFEDLFSSLVAMKKKAETLPSTERKDYAEKVALAFLSSLGDDEDAEI